MTIETELEIRLLGCCEAQKWLLQAKLRKAEDWEIRSYQRIFDISKANYEELLNKSRSL